MMLLCQLNCSAYHPYVTASSTAATASLHVPDLTQQRGEFVVVRPPGREHLRMVVVECSQLRQATQETSKVLRLLWMLQDAQLPQHVQHRLLESLNSLLILHIRPVWCQDGYGSEESLFFLRHVEFTDAFVKVEHGCDEFV